MKKIILLTIIFLTTQTAYSADNIPTTPYDEHTMQNFLAKIINLKGSYRLEDTIYYSTNADYSIGRIPRQLSHIKEQSKQPLLILLSDTSSSPEEFAHRAIVCHTAIASMISSLKDDSKVLCVRKAPTFKDALNTMLPKYGAEEDRLNHFYFSMLKYNGSFIDWLTAFKTKQKNGEISLSLTDFDRELNAIFDNFYTNMSDRRKATQQQLSVIADDLKKMSNEDYFFPSTP